VALKLLYPAGEFGDTRRAVDCLRSRKEGLENVAAVSGGNARPVARFARLRMASDAENADGMGTELRIRNHAKIYTGGFASGGSSAGHRKPLRRCLSHDPGDGGLVRQGSLPVLFHARRQAGERKHPDTGRGVEVSFHPRNGAASHHSARGISRRGEMDHGTPGRKNAGDPLFSELFLLVTRNGQSARVVGVWGRR